VRTPDAVSVLVLAAGASRRMGQPKQLLPLGGVPLLQHVVDRAATCGTGEAVVILGHQAAAVAEGLDLPPGVRMVINADHAAGQATSLRCGIMAVRAGTEAVLVLLGDQPGVRDDAIAAVVDAWVAGAGPVVRAVYMGRPGHPVLLGRPVWGDLARLVGDHGARELIQARPNLVHQVEVGGDPPEDVDTPDDFRRMTGASPGTG
jgi:molybdenum cofactor cytidylyltransferase